jgi:hypothetical protein
MSSSPNPDQAATRISLAMIVRHEESTPPYCLCSVAGQVDGEWSSTRVQATQHVPRFSDLSAPMAKCEGFGLCWVKLFGLGRSGEARQLRTSNPEQGETCREGA